MTGYKLAFGPDAATRIAELRRRTAFPGGQPSAEIMSRPIIGGPVVTPFGLSLQEFTDAFEGVPSLEPISDRSFVLRLTSTDPLTQQPEEWAFRLHAVEGPQDVPLASVFAGPAVYVDDMADNRVTASGLELFQIFNTPAGIAQRKRIGG